VFQNLAPLRDLSAIRRLFQPRCVNVCAISVAGSAGTFTRFSEDLARARQIFRCAGITLHQGGFMPVNDNSLLDLTEWTVTNEPADARRLLAMGPNCGRGERPSPFPTIFAYYVRTLGGGYNGIGRTNFANNAPGLVLSNAAGRWTFAHEIGHVLGLPHTDPMDTTNIMFFDSPNITVDPPVITPQQCLTARASNVPVPCTEALELPPVQAPRVIARPPFETTPALQGLLSDDPGVVERFAAMGPAILPQLLSRANDPNLAIRQRVLAVLARIGTPAALQAVTTAAQSDPDPSVRATAASALAQVRSPLSAMVLPRTLQDPDAGVRAAALRSLALMRVR
jgi:hypothetical protein